MAFGRTQEQKAAETRARAQLEEADRVKDEQDAFWASPIGQAVTAKQQEQGFFEVQLKVGTSQRDSTVWGGNDLAPAEVSTQSHAGLLAAIEGVGWRLEHVGHVFVVPGQSSHDTFMLTGQQTAVSGETMGIYLFRNSDTPA